MDTQVRKDELCSGMGTKGLVNNRSDQQMPAALNLFGQTSREQFQRISMVSPYSDLPGYKMIHIIIKSNDDLRQ